MHGDAGRKKGGWDGREHGGGTGGGASRDTVHGAAGRERGGWDGREHGDGTGGGKSRLDMDTVADAGREMGWLETRWRCWREE